MNIPDWDLRKRFQDHHPTARLTAVTAATIRSACLEAAQVIVDYTPGGREQALAITKLEEAMFWANAAIARPHDPSDVAGGAS